MKTLTEKRDALLRRRAELLEEWARNKAALLKRPEERPESAAGENMPPKRMRITGILGELDAELDRLERLIAEEARKDREEGPGKKAEERARSTAEEPAEEPAKEPAEEPAKEPAEEPTEAPAEEPEAPPVLPPALQSQVDSVLQRLEDCYPDHTVRGIVQRHRQLSEDLTTVCKQLGYATREDFLTAYGYRIGSWRRNQVPPVRRWTEPAAPPKGETDGVPRPRPEPSPEPEIPRKIEGEPGGSLDGQIAPESPEDLPVQYLREIGVLADSPGPRTGSADRLKQKTDSVLRRLEQYYPDHVIPGRLEQDHKSLSSDISEVYRLLGYESRKEFLNAYGYTYETSVGGRPSQDFQPMLDALIEKYRDRERPSAMGALLFENPEYKKSLKTLQNKAQELFGMSLVKYFQFIGIIAEKGTPRAASSAGREETAAGLSPAATARLKDLYQGLNPRFYGTFEDAVRKLEGLEAGCTRGVHARFCITGVTDCPPDVEIPQGFHFIQEGAFQNQEKLETVVLPESLTEIQSSAFENCTGLCRVTLPEGLKRIGDRAFAGCTALKEVDFQGGVPQVSESAFEGSAYRYTPPEAQGDSDGRDFIYTAASGGLTITGYTGSAEKLEVPKTIQGVPVRMIAKGAFSGNRYLSEVTMPDTIQRVQGLAFEGCISLRKIHLSNAMTKLINTTFNGCIGLREVNIPDGVTVLRKETFEDAPLERVHIGKGLEALDPGCFFRTYELEDGRNSHPQPLSDITVDPESPYLRAENSFVFSADGRTLYAFLGAGLCEIPEGVERIGPNAFAGRTRLTDVTFPSTLTEIGEYAFSGNSALRSVAFGERLRIIGKHAFSYCDRLSSALFGEGLEEIGEYAFESCPIRLVSLPSSLKKLGEDSFDCLSRYYNPRENPQELRIGPGGPIEADGDAVYQVDGESKTLVRTYGPRFSAYYYDYEDEDYDGEAEAVLTRYTVTEGTTAIARGAFEGCNRLLSVQLPDSLREIGPRAFYGCTRLGNIRLPQGLRSIGEEAFRGTAIQELTLPPELESVGVMAFAAREYYDEVTALKNIQVSAGNPRFQAADGFLLRQKEDGTRALMCAFGEDETMEVPEGVSEIEPLAFYRSAVKEVWLPASVTDVAMDAFRQCRNLVRLRLEFPQPENGLRRAVFYFPEFREEESYYDAYHAREQYLDCIRTNRDGVFDIVKYDSLFPSIQEFKDRILIATDRLKSAVQLVPLYRDEYLNWLRENAAEAVRTVIEFDDLAGLNTLAELGVFTGKNIDELIELANASRKPEILSYLMNYKNAEIGITETDYEL